LQDRKNYILETYGKFPVADLEACTMKLKKRLGDLRLRETIAALQENRMNDWLDTLLEYYDATYLFGLSSRQPETCFPITREPGEPIEELSRRIIDFVSEIKIQTLQPNE